MFGWLDKEENANFFMLGARKREKKGELVCKGRVDKEGVRNRFIVLLARIC